jgi:hypothetical protein
VNKRASWLIRRHEALLNDGFRPYIINVLPERGTVDCWICDHHKLQGMIGWRKAESQEVRYTGLTCFERVTDRLNLHKAEKKILHWAATHYSLLKGQGPLDSVTVEFRRLLSYKHPLSSAYGGEWKRVSKNIWKEQDRFSLSPLERGIVRTLVLHESPYWVRSSPTPRQRRLLNEALIRILQESYNEWVEDMGEP